MLDRHARIPCYTPEYIRDHKHLFGNYDKVPTTPIQSLRARNVEIESRYCKADELQTMLVAVCALSEQLVCCCKKFFCDSKHRSYTISISPWNYEIARAIADQVELAVINCDHVHNGIRVEALIQDALHIWCEPWHD